MYLRIFPLHRLQRRRQWDRGGELQLRHLGTLTSATETIPNANGWVNPFRFDGRDGVRYDAATGLDWMCVRAYDPTLGRAR